MPDFPSQDSASGIWTLKKHKRAQQGNNWPTMTPDEYFKYVSLLLNGNGINTAQNNTFLDSSTNNFTITRNGNTTQGTFSPYGTNWSNYFDGTGDYLLINNNAVLGLPAEFTFECWIFPNSFTQGASYGATIYDTVGSYGLAIGRPDSGSGNVWGVKGSIGLYSSTLPTNNTWNHIVVCRNSSNVLSLFLNGVRIATMTWSGTFSTGAATIGTNTVGVPDGFFNGYISNIRLVKGTDIYGATNTSINIPTTPLISITNTSFLLCNSKNFIDNSSNNLTITKYADVSVQVFSPFSPTAAYAAGTIGGSGYFDGTGDYLQLPTSLAAISGDFTIECYVYRQLSTNQGDFFSFFRNSSSGVPAVSLYSGTTGSLVATLSTDGTTGTNLSFPNIAVEGQWVHVAITRLGSTVRLFANGIAAGSTLTIAGALYSGDTNHYVGYGNFAFQGWIAGLRVVNGTALYTSNFTPPTTPPTAITNTQLLLNFTNGSIIDNARMNDLETVGNAQISTAQSKWGGSSIYLDGTGDGLSTPANINLAFGTGDFTIEMWVYGSLANNSSTVGGGWPRLFVLGTSQTAGCIESYVYQNSTIYVELFGTGSLTFTASTLLNSTWNHFAVVRFGTTLRLFVNGTQQATGTLSTNLNLPSTSSSWIGAVSSSVGNFNGYIDDLRITKGVARYTANFTPPTSSFKTY